jgi:hypothetical protein
VDYKYILSDGNVFVRSNTRPTQEHIKMWGFGEFTLYRGDASVAKVFTVVRNRNGNPTVHGTPPSHLDGMSTIRLERLARALAAVVKLWPEKSRDLDRVNKLLADRELILQKAVRSLGD